MKQNYTGKIIKKLFSNSLTPDEWQALLDSKEVREYMFRQWTAQSNATADNPERKKRIWKHIERTIENKKEILSYKYRRRLFRIAAVFLVLVTSGITGYLLYNQPEKEIILRSGIQQIETIHLPDGSVVKLGSGSILTYPSEFTHSHRIVSLNGQAFFEVHPNPEKPFIVQTDQMNITVLGTSFEVFDYSSEVLTETVLLEGTVRVEIKHSFPDVETTFTLLPDEKISVDKKKEEVTIEKVNANTYSAWRQGDLLSFENENLSMIIPRLERWYGKTIICNDKTAKKYRFKFRVKDESLEKILSIMGNTSSLKYKTDTSGNYILYEK